MPATQLTFAKVTSPVTENAWGISYNAGSLFAAISLSRKAHSSESTLAEAGKSFINALEAEFFTLETKSLETIKEAMKNCLSEVPHGMHLSGALGVSKDTVLYLFSVGHGSVLLKRGEKLGKLLPPHSETEEKNTIHAASGFLQTGDVIVLETQTFSNAITPAELVEPLDLQLPSDMAEAISQSLISKGDGAAAAILLKFTGNEGAQSIKTDAIEEEKKTSEQAESPQLHPALEEKEIESELDVKKVASNAIESEELVGTSDVPVIKKEISITEENNDSTFPVVPTSYNEEESNITEVVEESVKHTIATSFFRSKFLYIGLALLIFMILLGAIYTTKQKQQDTVLLAQYEEAYTAAKKDFDEGESLLSLNKGYAHDDYLSAQKRLTPFEGKLAENSDASKKQKELLSKIESRLSETNNVKKITAAKATDDDAPLLAQELTQKSLLGITEDKDAFYTLTDTEVTKTVKSTDKSSSLIKNKTDWKKATGISAYLGNIYILDQKEGILKFVAAGSGYVKNSYFSDTAPDLSTAVSMAVDGSIYILKSDGSILKFTKGKQDSFTISGLTTLPTNPKKIYTTVDLDNVYVLDTKNFQVLSFNKNGTFVSSYQADALKDAKDIVVSETDKKIYFLSQDSLWSIPLE